MKNKRFTRRVLICCAVVMAALAITGYFVGRAQPIGSATFGGSLSWVTDKATGVKRLHLPGVDDQPSALEFRVDMSTERGWAWPESRRVHIKLPTFEPNRSLLTAADIRRLVEASIQEALYVDSTHPERPNDVRVVWEISADAIRTPSVSAVRPIVFGRVANLLTIGAAVASGALLLAALLLILAGRKPS